MPWKSKQGMDCQLPVHTRGPTLPKSSTRVGRAEIRVYVPVCCSFAGSCVMVLERWGLSLKGAKYKPYTGTNQMIRRFLDRSPSTLPFLIGVSTGTVFGDLD
ncbi:UNVERIFIED_CONTAM: hypothetical protein FKN15_055975 [Acipenser sinensis]